MDSAASFTFIKHSLDTMEGIALFYYKLQTKNETYFFTETISFPKNIEKHIPQKLLKNILDSLLLILGISYWKTFCPKKIILENMSLTKDQASFWNTIYTKGLGEFYYKNKIDFRNYVHFPFDENANMSSVSFKSKNRSLLFFGGGKDSIVAAELLKKHDKTFDIFMVNQAYVQKKTASLVSVNNILFTRTIDKNLFQLNNKENIYNGHIPIFAVWGFLGIFAGILYNYRFLIGANEQSANYGNVLYLGQEINHQWDKSGEFEELLTKYVQKYISDSVTYFSLLRPFHEITIMKEFVKYEKYFPYFSSCNRNFLVSKSLEETTWCGKCSKCLFIFILLSAFLSKKKVLQIFNKNLFEDNSLLQIFKELLGVKNVKPFECVGTPEEVQLALLFIYEKKEYNSTLLMNYFITHVLSYIPHKKILNDAVMMKKIDKIPSEFQEVTV